MRFGYVTQHQVTTRTIPPSPSRRVASLSSLTRTPPFSSQTLSLNGFVHHAASVAFPRTVCSLSKLLRGGFRYPLGALPLRSVRLMS